MTPDEKRTAYRRQVVELLEYIEICVDRGVIPLRHDLNVFKVRFRTLDNRRVTR